MFSLKLNCVNTELEINDPTWTKFSPMFTFKGKKERRGGGGGLNKTRKKLSETLFHK